MKLGKHDVFGPKGRVTEREKERRWCMDIRMETGDPSVESG